MAITRSLRPKTRDVEGVKALFAKQGGRCVYTGKVLVPGGNASIDHIIPRASGGSGDISNLQFVDVRVNLAKRDMSHDEFIEMCKAVAGRFQNERGEGRAA